MKKFLLSMLVMLMCVSGGVAQAMQPQTTDITKRMLDLTERFVEPIRGRNLEMSKASYSECKAAYHALYSYLEAYKPQKDESGHVVEFLSEDDREVVRFAAGVIALRMYALNDYILALEASKNGDSAGYNAMAEACSRDLQYAVDYRQGFMNTYGY